MPKPVKSNLTKQQAWDQQMKKYYPKAFASAPTGMVDPRKVHHAFSMGIGGERIFAFGSVAARDQFVSHWAHCKARPCDNPFPEY